MIKMKKILVPIDFSECSELAMNYAATFAKEYGAQVHLLNVVEEGLYQAGLGSDTLNLAYSWVKENEQKLNETVTEELKQLDVVKRVESGLVYEKIIDYAKENNVNIIIMGARGKSGFIESWLGGTTYEITRKAPCAVLIVKPESVGFVEKKDVF